MVLAMFIDEENDRKNIPRYYKTKGVVFSNTIKRDRDFFVFVSPFQSQD
jgi:hypothetical protein